MFLESIVKVAAVVAFIKKEYDGWLTIVKALAEKRSA